jgi:hypothetical protein
MKKIVVSLLVSFSTMVFASNDEVGPIKLADLEVTPITTGTVGLAVRATRAQWNRALSLCHDHLTSHVINSAISDTVKIAYLSAIPQALQVGGVVEVWKRGNEVLRKTVMRSAADALETEAAALEARAAILRRFATAIDDNASSYSVDMEPFTILP